MNTAPPDEGTPQPAAPDYAAALEEQKAVITALNDKIKALEAQNADFDAKITALSTPQPSKPKNEELSAKISDFDKAYNKVLEELGIKKE